MGISDYEKTIKYLVLSMMKGIGTVTQNALLDVCGSIDQCFSVDAEEFLCRDMDDRLGRSRIRLFVSQREDKELWEHAEAVISDSMKKGIDITVREDSIFPRRFANIPDMPILLYTKGEMRINEYSMSTGIVGARRCTPEGKEKAIEITQMSVNDGAAIISGMAKGVDSYAHTAALRAHGYTLAVLGNGVDICYPKEHERLYEMIAEKGCILSEYPPEIKPREYLFPKRNRLIAALSDHLYVIEAGRNSGTATTVKKAEEYGRKVRSLCDCEKAVVVL